MYVVRYQHIRYIVYTELTEATFDFLERTNDKLVRHCCRFWQQSRMLLRQSQSLLRHCFNCCYFVRVTGQNISADFKIQNSKFKFIRHK